MFLKEHNMYLTCWHKNYNIIVVSFLDCDLDIFNECKVFVIMFRKKAPRIFPSNIKTTKRLSRCECALQGSSKEIKEGFN